MYLSMKVKRRKEMMIDKPIPLYYLETECPNCGRLRVEHWSNGKDVCEKCLWCIQDEDYYWEIDL